MEGHATVHCLCVELFKLYHVCSVYKLYYVICTLCGAGNSILYGCMHRHSLVTAVLNMHIDMD